MSQGSAGYEQAQFRRTFFEECSELLADMEARVTSLQSEQVSEEELNAIFRAVHSVKAGAGAFGFKELVAFAHTFEALLDRLRDGRIAQTERVSQTIMRAADILAALVAAAQEERAIGPGFGADVADELQSILDENDGPQPQGTTADSEAAAEEAGPGGTRRFEIRFRPFADLYRNANDPLLLLRELRGLGEAEISCDTSRVPALAALDAEESYLSWSVVLTTDKSRQQVLEVFEFVEGDCELVVDEAGSQEAVVASADDAGSDAAVRIAPAAGRVAAAPPGGGAAPARATVSSIRVDLSRVDRLVNMVGELVITQAMLAQQIDGLTSDGAQGIRGHEELATLTRELQECVMAIRMQPVKSVFARMPRLVRELSGKLGKRVRLVTSGEQTEVDKTVVEELADPLTHMIRNAIDHGIEDGETRLRLGKPEEATIELSASHAGNNILIHVADDGGGINRERVLQKAIEKGIVPPGAMLSDEEIDDLIFAPGFSTAAEVTDVSGRGVGMDVVRRNIVNLGGRIQVHSTAGKGTRFTLVIPLTLAVLDGMLVAVGRERYILPLTSIVESFRPEPGQVRKLAGGGEVASIRGEYFRLVHLYRVFDVPGAVTEPWKGLVVLVETAKGGKIGIMVDELIGQQQVVTKSLQENFDPVPGLSGATILGNGRVALILDIEQLASLSERGPPAMASLAPSLFSSLAEETEAGVQEFAS